MFSIEMQITLCNIHAIHSATKSIRKQFKNVNEETITHDDHPNNGDGIQ